MGSEGEQCQKCSFVGFTQNKCIGGEYALLLGVILEVFRCEPETSETGDRRASPAEQSGILQLAKGDQDHAGSAEAWRDDTLQQWRGGKPPAESPCSILCSTS